MVIFVPILGHVYIASFYDYWLRIILGGLCFACLNVLTYKTLVYFDAAISTTATSCLSAIFTVISAALILKEDMKTNQIIGGIILMTAVIYVILATQYNRKHKKNKNLLVGSIYVLLTGLAFSLAVTNEKSLLGHMTAATYIFFGVGAQAVMSIALALIMQRRNIRILFNKDIAIPVILAGVLNS